MTNIFFVLAILIFSITSLFHVTVFWLITNSLFLAIIMSVGTGLGIISSLLSTRYTKLTYISFFLIILIELFGNIYGAFIHIDITSEYFKGWKELMQPVFAMMYPMEDGVEIPDAIYKRWVAIIQGSFIPLLLSITFHMWMVVREKYQVVTPIQNKTPEVKKEVPSETKKSNEGNIISEFLNLSNLDVKSLTSNLLGNSDRRRKPAEKKPIQNKPIDTQSEEKKMIEIPEEPIQEVQEVVEEKIEEVIPEDNSLKADIKAPEKVVKRSRVINTKSSDFGKIVLKPK